MKDLQCLICDKLMQYGYQLTSSDHVLNTSDDIEDGGTLHVTFGYGSKFDCISACAVICDKCFDAKREKFHNEFDSLSCLR